MEELKEIMSQAEKLCLAFTNAINYAHNTTKEAEEKLKQVEAREKDATVKEGVLDGREAKVSKVEGIIALEKSAKELEKKNALALDNLTNMQLAFDKTSKDTLRKITEEKAKVADDNLLLTKGWESLRAKEKSYRAEIEADIMKRFKK